MKCPTVVRLLALVLALVVHAAHARSDEAAACPNPPPSQTCGFEKWKVEKHHFLTNKGKKELGWKKKFQKILDDYDLSVDDPWNVEPLHHKGPHPTKYHEFVHCQLKRADSEANKNPEKLKALIELYIKVPVRAHLCMLQKPK